ncbi:uncharacterized protein LOC129807373 [Phlebotomus papatasi]|uniref:uncharacterized protein LOC129807373 n=1 Tax=Phlebotomus papatasi TaxID=29031 RepID=UPI00248448E5|nr:uncharacterized protein LOC129807373 [Phlebotomus papatasi]
MLPLSLGVPLAIVSVIGLLMNGYILLVVILTKQISANNLLLLHLGLVDSLLCFLFLLFSLPSIARPGSWLITEETPCNLHGLLLILLHPVALWTVCGLNCDRFYAIAAPLHYGTLVNTRKVILGLGCGWLVAILLCIPPFVSVAPFRYSPDLGACTPDFELSGSLWYALAYTLITFILPGVLIVGCNIKVLMIARYHRHRIASAIYEVTLSAQVTITHQRNPFFVPTVTAPSAGGPKFRSRSPVSSVLQLVGSFFILYVPYYVVILWQGVTSIMYENHNGEDVRVNRHLVLTAAVLLTCSSPVNGLLYGLKSKVMRKTFQNYWRKQMSKNQMNHEIQARTPSTCGSRRPSLTPLGFLTRPALQRRLSETLINLDRGADGTGKPQMKRIASELAWRPINFNGELDSPTAPHRDSIPHTSSCNTLQVPKVDNEVATVADQELYLSLKNSFRGSTKSGPNPRAHNSFVSSAKPVLSTANLLLHKVLRIEHGQSNGDSYHNMKKLPAQISPPRRSPRILITRAFSEESDKTPSGPGSPAKEKLHRQYSSSCTLLERKWKMVKYQDEETRESDSETDSRKPDSSTASNSTTVSEASCRRYSSLEEHTSLGRDAFGETEPAEEQLLLSWPTTRKKFGAISRQRKFNGNSTILGHRSLRPNPLYSDRSEEPEVVL